MILDRCTSPLYTRRMNEGQRSTAPPHVEGAALIENRMNTYHVVYERDESGWWVASVREVRGCHTQGRTVDEARRRVRKALELFIDDARSAKLVDNVKLPAPAS